MTDTIEDGIYPDVPEEEYRAWPFANQTYLKILARGGTPAHYKALVDGSDTGTTRAKSIGRYMHMALLEPERLDNIRKLPDEIKRRTGTDWEQLCAENPGVTFLSPSEWVAESKYIDAARTCLDNVATHPIAAEMLRESQKEVSFVWTDSISGVRCKGRADIFKPCMVGDVKSTSDLTPYQMARNAYKYGYHIQSAFYTDGLTQLLGRSTYLPFWFLYIGTEPPYLISVHNGHAAYDERSDSNDPHGFLNIGREEYQAALQTIRQCEQSGEWPGYPLEPQDMVIPKWAAWGIT